MPQSLSKSFEKEKKEIDVDSDFEDLSLDIEKIEQSKESSFEQEVVDFEKKPEEKDQEEEKEEVISPLAAPAPTLISPEEERRKQIDLILSEGLNDVFLNMTKKQQKEFQEKGIKTVNKINKLLSQTKVKVKKIVDLIKSWLKTIPKVNRYFLEQEAKIKTDKIIKLKDNKNKK